jgi:hypothetical protein
VAPHYPMQLERPMRGHLGPYTMDPHPLPNRYVCIESAGHTRLFQSRASAHGHAPTRIVTTGKSTAEPANTLASCAGQRT